MTKWLFKSYRKQQLTPELRFAKPMGVLPQDLVKPRNREIQFQTFPNPLNIAKLLGSSTTEMAVKYQGDTIIMKSHLAISRLRKIRW